VVVAKAPNVLYFYRMRVVYDVGVYEEVDAASAPAAILGEREKFLALDTGFGLETSLDGGGRYVVLAINPC
jgi:hypothetical protein